MFLVLRKTHLVMLIRNYFYSGQIMRNKIMPIHAKYVMALLFYKKPRLLFLDLNLFFLRMLPNHTDSYAITSVTDRDCFSNNSTLKSQKSSIHPNAPTHPILIQYFIKCINYTKSTQVYLFLFTSLNICVNFHLFQLYILFLCVYC